MTQLETRQTIIALLRKSKNILILPSAPIDGDSLGSSLAMHLVLKKLGIDSTIVAEEKISKNYDFLPAIQQISQSLDVSQDFVITIDCRDRNIKNVRHEIQGNKLNIFVTPESGVIDEDWVSFKKGDFQYDCIIAVDAADPVQFGSIYDNFSELFHLAPVINIDHHASNKSFGKINLVDMMASSTTTLILQLIEELDKKLIDADIATLLLAGLITDTGSFQNPNTTPDAFATAALLINYGARQQEIIKHIYKTKQLSQLRLWGRTLLKLQVDEKYRLVWSVLTKKDFEEIGSSPEQTEGVIDELMSNAPNAEIVLLLKEKNGFVKGSLRTITPSLDASELAKIFGGGGHTRASGFVISNLPIEEALQKVLTEFRKIQAFRLNIKDSPEQIQNAPKPELQPIYTEPKETKQEIILGTKDPGSQKQALPISPIPAQTPAPSPKPAAPVPSPVPQSPVPAPVPITVPTKQQTPGTPIPAPIKTALPPQPIKETYPEPLPPIKSAPISPQMPPASLPPVI